MARRKKTLEETYHSILARFMSFRDATDYTEHTVFSQEQLAAVIPNDLVRWMNLFAYGAVNPGRDARPLEGRANSIETYKKSISFFMPNKSIAWDEILLRGNPTKSADVNRLIRYVKQQEVRRLGAPSRARRAITKHEFELTLLKLNTFDDFNRKFMIPTSCKFQFCTISRIDDASKFRLEDLNPNPQFPSFTLVSRICWSKNVMEERDAPDQIMFGSMDSRYCILLALGIYLEVSCEVGDGLTNPFLFGHGDPGTNKAFVAETLKRDIWGVTGDVVKQSDGNLGTHSIRKFATSFARRNGCQKDDVSSRGRWRKRQVVDRYIDVNLPYPDAKVASVLAMGGPIKYSLKNLSGVTEAWLRENVVPHMCRSRHLHKQVSLVLALPILWAAFDSGMESFMPGSLRSRIHTAYDNLETRLEDGQNPVRKILVVVTGQDDEVHIDEVFPDNDGDMGNEEGACASNAPINGIGAGRDYQLKAIYSQLTILRREIHLGLDQIAEAQSQKYRDINEKLDHMRRSITRVAQQPIQRPRDVGIPHNNIEVAQGQGIMANATLSRTPRSLHILWCEYEIGIGGRKAAREFTVLERGKVKCAYCKRKVVWDKIAEMVRAGHSAQVAIDMIYHAYGAGTSVTEIIKLMRRDNHVGTGHPYLRV